MNRLTIFAFAGAGQILAALAWFLAAKPGAPATISAELLSRSAGVVLLGFVLIAAGMVFRTALRAEQKPSAATTGRRASEYRRGFGDRAVRTRAQPTQRDSVRSLRGAVVERGQRPILAATGTTPPMAEIERLHDKLHRRAAQTSAPNKRHGIDEHDLASH